MLQTRRQRLPLLLVVASLVMSSPCLGTPPAHVVLVERHPLDQAAFDALELLQRQETRNRVWGVEDKILQALPVFVKAVAAEDPYVRFAALWALEEIWRKGGAMYHEELQLRVAEFCDQYPGSEWCGLLDEKPQTVERWEAALAAIDVPALTDVLLHTLDDEDFWVQVQAIEALATIHEITPQNEGRTQHMLAALLNLTKAPNPFIREAAYRNVAGWRDHAIVRNTPNEAHRDATWLVRQVGDIRQREAVRAGLRDADPVIRVMAIRGLMVGAMGDGPEATAFVREELLERVRDPHGEVSSEAVFSFMRLNDKKAIGPLLALWDFPHSNAMNKRFIEQALRKLSGKSLTDLKQKFGWPPKHKIVNYAPVRRKSPARLQRLYQEAETGSWTERISALLELTWVEEPAAYAAINQGLGDPDARVRYAALTLSQRQLNGLGVWEHFEIYLYNIHRALQDPNRHVQKAAIYLITAMEIPGYKKYSFGGRRRSIIDEISAKAVQAEDGFIRHAAINALKVLTPERYLIPDVP